MTAPEWPMVKRCAREGTSYEMLHWATTAGVLATMSGRTVVPGIPAFGYLYSKVHASSGDATGSSALVWMIEQRQCRKACAH